MIAKNYICPTTKRAQHRSSTWTSMVVLAVLVVILAVYALNNKRKKQKPHQASVAPPAPSDENLGTRQRLGTLKSGIDCNNVALDSPDFARCATTLGAARSLYPRRPGNSSRPVDYEDELGASRLKGEAFPFTQKSGPVRDRDAFQSKPNKIREKMQEVVAEEFLLRRHSWGRGFSVVVVFFFFFLLVS